MPPVAVRILHPLPDPGAGPLVRWVADARAALAERHRRGFEQAGAGHVAIVEGSADGRTFGARLRELAMGGQPGGLVVLGSGSIPLATIADRRSFVQAAGAEDRRALANNRYSADVVAIARADRLPAIPDLPGDNALPRWLEEVAGYEVEDLGRRWRLAVDIDGPLDLLLTGSREAPRDIDIVPVISRLAAVQRVARDPRAELLVAGRTSATTLAWLERHTASRTRAIIEERGLRAASRLAQAEGAAAATTATQRPPASILGALLDRDGPESFGEHLARLADAAMVDTRVLLAHRLGSDQAGWPPAEDRFASDLLLPDRISDPWLRGLTASAAAAPIPISLGGHTLVGPGVRLVMGGSWS
jgi:hypothetical protein